MSAVNSPVGICNLAFYLLRQKEQVQSLETPDTDSEIMAAHWYDTTRRAVLAAFYWNFARKRAALSLNAVAPAFGYANAYNLPNDYLSLMFIGDNYTEDYETEYTIENNQILISNDDGATLNIGYVYDHTNVNLFDPLFIELLVAELAIRFANSVTGVNKSMKEINAWKTTLEVKARAKNGHDNPPKRREVSPLITKRRRLSTGGTTDGVHLFT